MSISQLFRPAVQRLAGYAPGEQPQTAGWIKLNTNENPYPPSPRVIEALERAVRGRLNVYPDPLGTEFRSVAARLFDVGPDSILPANGSDENLTILIRSFVDPGDVVAFPYPSYILYETLVALQGGQSVRLPLNADWTFDLDQARPLVERSKLVIVPNPNSPSGTLWSAAQLEALIPPAGLLVVDEAYADFAHPLSMPSADPPGAPQPESVGRALLRGCDRVLITRTFSKSFSLAGMRLGFAVACPEAVAGMRKMKDSYNCDTLSLVAGTAALSDLEWMQQNVARITQTRTRLQAALGELGFAVPPSHANFVWAVHAEVPAAEIDARLRDRRILVRRMSFPNAAGAPGGVLNGLRISIGTDEETDALLAALREIV